MIKLIASAAYVDQELAAEFGRLPPAFLPIGVSRLYEAQVPAICGGPVFLTLPESFEPHAVDVARLHELGNGYEALPLGRERVVAYASVHEGVGHVPAHDDPVCHP